MEKKMNLKKIYEEEDLFPRKKKKGQIANAHFRLLCLYLK